MPRPTTAPTLPPIHTIRGQCVVLDSDRAALYGVLTKRLNEAVRRNGDRFPEDFCFQLTVEEGVLLRSKIATSKMEGTLKERVVSNWSQIATGSIKHSGVTYRHWAFTEYGALTAATALKSPQAIQMSLYVVRAFVRMREELMTSAVIFKRLAHGARQRVVGVVKCNGTARKKLAGETRRVPFGHRVEQIDKRLLEHDVVLQDVVEKLLPPLNPPPDPPKRRIGFHQDSGCSCPTQA
jgi:hypothetical protein